VVHEPSDANESREPGQVLKFRLRRAAGVPFPGRAATTPDQDTDELIDDLAQYEQEHGEIDYRHRMLMNVIALVVVSLLVGAGVWIADTIADMEKAQDCVMQGRQNCAPIEAPAANR
jgi:hypothetical protein